MGLTVICVCPQHTSPSLSWEKCLPSLKTKKWKKVTESDVSKQHQLLRSSWTMLVRSADKNAQHFTELYKICENFWDNARQNPQPLYLKVTPQVQGRQAQTHIITFSLQFKVFLYFYPVILTDSLKFTYIIILEVHKTLLRRIPSSKTFCKNTVKKPKQKPGKKN